MRKRADARQLWADEHEPVADARTSGREQGEVTAKQRAVLSMQGKVGNAGVSRSVQRFFWGDTSDWQAMLGGGAAGGGPAVGGKTDGSKVLDGGAAAGGPAMGPKTDGSMLGAGPAEKTAQFEKQSSGQVTEVHVLGYDDQNEKQILGKGAPTSSGQGAKQGPALSGGAGSGKEDLWADTPDQSDGGEVAAPSKKTMEPEKEEGGGDW